MLLVAIAAGCARVAVGAARPKPVRSGMEVLLTDSLHLIRGKRVGLVTNLAAVGSNGTDVVTMMRAAPVTLVALFGPEHGLSAQAAPGGARRQRRRQRQPHSNLLTLWRHSPPDP
jgi:uncharacterized protein YbbC (DUF1343 family)